MRGKQLRRSSNAGKDSGYSGSDNQLTRCSKNDITLTYNYIKQLIDSNFSITIIQVIF